MSNTNPIGFAQGAHRDRASIIIATVFGLVTDALRDWAHREPVDLSGVRAQAEAFLRDEIDDIKREVAGERFLAD